MKLSKLACIVIDNQRQLWVVFVFLLAVVMGGCAAAPETPDEDTPAPPVDLETMDVVSGYVVGGGDTTPEGLSDAPRNFVYQVEMEDGFVVEVTYTAFPPSPVGDEAAERVRLAFHAGTISVGDYLVAHGTYDADRMMFVVAEEGDYIETYPEKP